MGKPRGNPKIRQYSFTTERSEPLLAKLTVRIPASMQAKLDQMDDYPEFVRQAIWEKMEREGIKDT
jgi:hypothetical protein